LRREKVMSLAREKVVSLTREKPSEFPVKRIFVKSLRPTPTWG